MLQVVLSSLPCKFTGSAFDNKLKAHHHSRRASAQVGEKPFGDSEKWPTATSPTLPISAPYLNEVESHDKTQQPLCLCLITCEKSRLVPESSQTLCFPSLWNVACRKTDEINSEHINIREESLSIPPLVSAILNGNSPHLETRRDNNAYRHSARHDHNLLRR